MCIKTARIVNYVDACHFRILNERSLFLGEMMRVLNYLGTKTQLILSGRTFELYVRVNYATTVGQESV